MDKKRRPSHSHVIERKVYNDTEECWSLTGQTERSQEKWILYAPWSQPSKPLIARKQPWLSLPGCGRLLWQLRKLAQCGRNKTPCMSKGSRGGVTLVWEPLHVGSPTQHKDTGREGVLAAAVRSRDSIVYRGQQAQKSFQVKCVYRGKTKL